MQPTGKWCSTDFLAQEETGHREPTAMLMVVIRKLSTATDYCRNKYIMFIIIPYRQNIWVQKSGPIARAFVVHNPCGLAIVTATTPGCR